MVPEKDIAELTTQAYKSIRRIKQRPVDIFWYLPSILQKNDMHLETGLALRGSVTLGEAAEN